MGSKRRFTPNRNGSTHKHPTTALRGGAQQLTEQDLAQAMHKGHSRPASASANAGLNPTPDRDGAKNVPTSTLPTVIPITRKAQPLLSSSEEDDGYSDNEGDGESSGDEELPGDDDEEDSDDPIEDIEATAVVGSVDPQIKGHAGTRPEEALTTSLDGRPYNTFRNAQGVLKTAPGLQLPTGYQLWDDPTYPYICPVRNCRRILPKLQSLGAHLYVSYCCCLFFA